MKILVSACLAGINCKYDGTNNYHQIIEELQEKHDVILACPEELGGLPTPRIPAEIIENEEGLFVVNEAGEDVTTFFKEGASKTLQIAQKHDVDIIILQKRSPSCGVYQIYDGTHKNVLIEGSGLTTRLLQQHGFTVITIDQIKQLKII